jgi:hypothetical protein
MIFAGGTPLRRSGAVIGAIGVSGGDGNRDQTVATAGAAAFSNRVGVCAREVRISREIRHPLRCGCGHCGLTGIIYVEPKDRRI